MRQCLIYDSPERNARLIGVEYMVSPRIYDTLPPEERKLWHSHVYEVKSGMLVMPLPNTAPVPTSAWEVAETKEMEDTISFYGKTYHFWQVDRGDKVPMGEPQLMTSFTEDSQVNKALWKERDERLAVDSQAKSGKRAHIQEPKVHPDADSAWKQ